MYMENNVVFQLNKALYGLKQSTTGVEEANLEGFPEQRSTRIQFKWFYSALFVSAGGFTFLSLYAVDMMVTDQEAVPGSCFNY